METITSIADGDAQARGQIRHWKKKLAERYDHFLRAYADKNVSTAIAVDMIKGSGATPRRALNKLTAAFGLGAVLEQAEIKKRNQDYALWSILKPRKGIIAVDFQIRLTKAEIGSLTQDCVSVNYSYVGVRDGLIYTGEGLWTLEVPDHALGRAVERSRLLTPETIIREAHRNVLGAPLKGARRNGYIKAGAGCFAVELIGGKDVSAGGALQFHIRANTWLADDMLGPDQIPIFGEGEAGNRMGELVLFPLSLRAAIEGDLR